MRHAGRLTGWAGPDRDIDLIGDRVDPPVLDGKVDPDLRIALMKRGHGRG